MPIPVGPTLAAINAVLLAQMDARLEATRDAAGQTIGLRFTEEQRQCRPVPLAFDAAATTLATVTPRALIRLEGAVYSVWTRWVGLDLVIRIGPSTVTSVGRDGTCIQHPRKRFGERAIDYRHYLPELARKPQAAHEESLVFHAFRAPAQLASAALLSLRFSLRRADRAFRAPCRGHPRAAFLNHDVHQ